MTFFYLTNFSYVKTVLTTWSVSRFAIFKNRHVFADPITYSSSDLFLSIGGHSTASGNQQVKIDFL